MDTITISIILTASLLALLSAGVWVALTLMAVGLLGMTLMGLGSSGLIFATTTWGTSSSWALTALPLFIWMGEILFKTKLSKALFEGLTPWLGRIPGQLLHVNILSCGVFAAVSGSSAATAATIGAGSVGSAPGAGLCVDVEGITCGMMGIEVEEEEDGNVTVMYELNICKEDQSEISDEEIENVTARVIVGLSELGDGLIEKLGYPFYAGTSYTIALTM